MAQRKLICDVDGVVANFLAEAIRAWGSPQIPHTWSLEEMFPQVPDDQIAAFLSQETTYLRLKPIEGACEALQVLRNSGWHITFVTARPKHLIGITTAWLIQYGFATEKTPIIFADKASVVLTRKAKAAIEDNVEAARAMAQVCPRVFLMDRPYNFGPCGKAMRVVGDTDWEKWAAIVQLLEAQ